MDIIRGNLDGISRPASNSRIHPESRTSSASLEVLTPEPVSIKVDTSINLNSTSQQSNRENYSFRENRSINGKKKHDTQKVDHSLHEQIKTSCTEYSGILVELNASLIASEDEYEVQYFTLFDMPQDILSQAKEDVSKIKELDLQLQEAVKKMKRLDKLLVEKQFKEKEIKKQGQEMRTKLWEELRAIKNYDAIQSNEEMENTKKFVTLATSSEGTTDSSHLEQEEPFVSVFHTQIPPEEYENCIEQARQEAVYQSESNKSLIKPEKKPQRENYGELKGKKNQDFIKRNIELAKDSKSVVFMMDKEKRRLIELLKDIDDGEDTLPSTEDGGSAWLIPEKGYMSAAHIEREQLAQIDSKLQERFFLTSLGLSNDFSGVDNQTGQEETALNDNTQVKVTPGDKALRNTKEHREEKNRLKEIDQQLRELEEDSVKTPQILSEEQLKTLLEECILEQKSEKESRDADGIQAESIQPSISFISQLLNMSPDLSSPEVGNDDILENGECETPGYYLTKALGGQHYIEEFLVAETKEEESPRPLGDVASSDVEGYFMSKTLGIGRLKRPSFLDDPVYCIRGPSSEDEQLKLIDCSTESSSKPDELTIEDKTEEEERDS
ncbi:fibrous sheath-interacting protein 1 [Trichosurus vulpecula]|uniref:fibrous sheath-interacting protein 1 n=1 Tax=Trichosurus vulpecula TaxID=9337 RepID=UPI00186AF56B|nr:fibrous sheath-interacting protein 1 [Trichosurus vulpecula]